MNYEKNYYDYIAYVKTFVRKKGGNVYYEKHHVVPSCVGGTNDKNNIVLLTAREHFLAHYLLTKIYKDTNHSYSIHYAFIRMKGKGSGRPYYNSILYESAKIEFAKGVSKNRKGKTTWNKGIPCSNPVREATSKANKGKTPWNKGKKTPSPDALSNKKRSNTLKDYYSKNLSKLIGIVPWSSGKRKIQRGENFKYVYKEDLREYLEDGWHRTNEREKSHEK